MISRAVAIAILSATALVGCTAIDDMSDDQATRAGRSRSGYMIAVEPGETLDDVAQRMRVSRDALIQANHLRPPYRVESPQALLVPPPASYRVQGGDTVQGIATTLGVDEGALAAANGLRRPYQMRVNQILRVPGGIGGETALSFEPTAPAETAELPFSGGAPQRRSAISAQPLAPPPGLSAGVAGPPTVQPYTPPATPSPAPPPLAPIAPAPRQSYPQPSAAPTVLVPPRQPPQPPHRAPPPPPVAPAPAVEVPVPEQPPAPLPASEKPARTAPAAAAASNGPPHFLRPVSGDVVSAFGPDGSGQTNEGINISASAGTPVRAAAAGTVIYAGNELAAFGNLLLVRHDGGWVTAYGHLGSIAVQRGAAVTQGQTIGVVGQTGSAKSPQLHFEVRQGSKPVDPTPFLAGG